MKFSIIVPFYNVEKYIEQCLLSLINQNYPKDDYEIIVIDDCSSDESRRIVERLAFMHPKLHLISHNVNKRQGGARNTGILAAKGEWIFFVDSDDCWANTDVLNAFKTIIDKYAGIQVIKSKNYGYTCTSAPTLEVIKPISGLDYLCSVDYHVNIWTGCYNRKFIINNNLLFRENVVFEDSDWSLKVVIKTSMLLLINYPFYIYRVNTGSTTNGYSYAAFHDNISSAFVIENIMYENNLPDRARIKCRNFILKSIMTFVKTSRNYSNDVAIEQLSRLQGESVINKKHYRLSYYQNIIFFLLNYNVSLLVKSVKMLTKGKRFVTYLIRK